MNTTPDLQSCLVQWSENVETISVRLAGRRFTGKQDWWRFGHLKPLPETAFPFQLTPGHTMEDVFECGEFLLMGIGAYLKGIFILPHHNTTGETVASLTGPQTSHIFGAMLKGSWETDK